MREDIGEKHACSLLIETPASLVEYGHREPMRRDRLIFVLFGFIYLLTLKYHRKSAIIYLILKIFTFCIVGL